jgi:hypothetical protein
VSRQLWKNNEVSALRFSGSDRVDYFGGITSYVAVGRIDLGDGDFHRKPLASMTPGRIS